MLKINDLHTYYGNIHILKGVSLHVPKGDIVSFIGANGAGKTTTMKTIAGLIAPSSGEILLKGKQVQAKKPHQLVASGLSLVPEGRQILGTLSVLENLTLGAYLRKDKEGVLTDLEKMFARFPILKERSGQSAGTLSGGQQQMLAIARSLMSSPEILLLDEPSMGLAPAIVQEIFETIVAINKEGTSILIVEQNVKQALRIASYGYILESGRVILEGVAASLIEDERVVKAYLGG